MYLSMEEREKPSMGLRRYSWKRVEVLEEVGADGA